MREFASHYWIPFGGGQRLHNVLIEELMNSYEIWIWISQHQMRYKVFDKARLRMTPCYKFSGRMTPLYSIIHNFFLGLKRMHKTRENVGIIFHGNVINRRPVASTTLSVVNSGDFVKLITFPSNWLTIPHCTKNTHSRACTRGLSGTRATLVWFFLFKKTLLCYYYCWLYCKALHVHAYDFFEMSFSNLFVFWYVRTSSVRILFDYNLIVFYLWINKVHQTI